MELFNGLGYALHNGYGMSEIGITSVELGDKPKDRNKNSVGRPFDSVEYRISDENTLLVKGNSTCYAMMVNGEYKKTEEWFDTRDIMEVDDKGNYYIKGRIGDSVIGENGENINPDVIEKSFQLADALCFSVLGIPNENEAGEVLSMIVSISPYLSSTRVSAMLDAMYKVNEQLPMSSRIQKFYFTYDEIAPATAIKVGRKYVLRGLQNGTIHLIPAADIRNQLKSQPEGELNQELVKRICEIVAEELGLELEQKNESDNIIGEEAKKNIYGIDIDAHVMYDLGATSLQYFSMMSKMAEEFNITAEFSEDEYTYTIREFCKYIEENV